MTVLELITSSWLLKRLHFKLVVPMSTAKIAEFLDCVDVAVAAIGGGDGGLDSAISFVHFFVVEYKST